MKLEALVIQLEAVVQEELNAQARMLELLNAQKSAVALGGSPDVRRAADAIEGALATEPGRGRRRAALLEQLARHFGVRAGTLTLTSIRDRAAAEGVAIDRLDRLRQELRRATADVLRAGRQITAVARYHQGVMEEVMGILCANGASQAGAKDHDRGRLVDATA